MAFAKPEFLARFDEQVNAYNDLSFEIKMETVKLHRDRCKQIILGVEQYQSFYGHPLC